MRSTRRCQAALALAVLALIGATACGSDDDAEQAQSATTVVTETDEASDDLEEAIETVQEELEDAMTIDLEEQNGSGISGSATIAPSGTDEIRVTLTLSGGEGGVARPAHIHEGSCADLNPTPKYPLENVVGGRSETTVRVAATDLLDGEFAINVHESEDNAGRYVACGDLRR
jgi:hypothetical protein